MSSAALLQAVRSHLVRHCGYSVHTEIDARPSPGMPPAKAGPRWVSVVVSKSSETQNRALQEKYECRIVVSLRASATPWSNWGEGKWIEANQGLETEVRRILAAMHGAGTNGIDLLNEANKLITEDANKFLSGIPFLFRDEQGPDPKSPAWWQSTGDNWAGISSTLVFGYAQRIQKVDCIT